MIATTAATTYIAQPETAAPADSVSREKIAVRGVNFWYGASQALFDIDLSVPEFSVMALIGPSGCGKSTLLRIVNRMAELVEGSRMSGEVRIDDRDVYGPEQDLVDLRHRVGMVFQKSNPFPKSIYDNVAFGPRSSGIRDRRRLDYLVERCLKQAALWTEVRDRLHLSALELSGGQQQRLCIARALATTPEVLLMDEPASALDPKAARAIEDLIAELKRDYTIVIVTHNMQQAARVSDMAAFLYEGRLVEVGRTEQVFRNPRQKETENYISGRFG